MTGAAAGAGEDGRVWAELLRLAESSMPMIREVDVTGFDPGSDLDRRTRRWGHHMSACRLPELLAFGVALARAEETAWSEDDPVVATRAFEDRRFLFSDRLVHWVVPVAAASDLPDARALRALLLDHGDRLRPAPAMTGGEGLHPPGEDSYGPTHRPLLVPLGDPGRWRDLAAEHPGTARLWLDLARRAG